MNTKQTWCILALPVIFATLLVSPLFAEEPVEQLDNVEYWSCCWGDRYGGNRGRYFKSYDFQTTETLNGKVVSLDSLPSRRDFPRTHLIVQTDKETIEVHLAPSWYLAEQDFDLTLQDKITIIGSRINIDGQEAIVAREIINRDKTLTLRDRDGIPLWHRGRIPTINN